MVVSIETDGTGVQLTVDGKGPLERVCLHLASSQLFGVVVHVVVVILIGQDGRTIRSSATYLVLAVSRNSGGHLRIDVLLIR